MNNVDTLFLVRMTDIDGNISYLNKSYERNFTTRNFASVFNVQDTDKLGFRYESKISSTRRSIKPLLEDLIHS